jgi:hypothetical protein
MLQNRHVPLKNENKMYVPSTYSNMYGEFGAVGRQESLQDRQLLFTKRPLHTELPEIVNRIGQDRFHNNTRTQLRGL